jgi:flagellar hook-associated protein 2
VRSTTSSDTDIFTASAGADAVAGTYEVEVTALARAHQLRSNVFAGGSSQVVGTGTLTLQLGSESFAVAIDGTNSTLAGIRDAINAAADNPGVAATLVNGSGGAHLILSSSQTGAANAITVTQSGDAGLEQLTYGPGDLTRYTQISPAQNAAALIAGVPVSSSTNSIENAIDGVTLNLAAAEPGTTLTLTVAQDKTTVSNRIKSFVAAYNSMQTSLARLRSYDATTRAAGPMLGDSLLNGTESQLRRMISDNVAGTSGEFRTLSSIGITTQANGSLKIDETKLSKALEGSFDAVSRVFGSTEGVAAKLNSYIEDSLDTGSAIDTRTQALVKQQVALTKKSSDIDARMAVLQGSYIRQFSALDNLLSQLQTTSSFLTQQLDNLPKMGE